MATARSVTGSYLSSFCRFSNNSFFPTVKIEPCFFKAGCMQKGLAVNKIKQLDKFALVADFKKAYLHNTISTVFCNVIRRKRYNSSRVNLSLLCFS